MEWNIGNGSIPEVVGELLGQPAYCSYRGQ